MLEFTKVDEIVNKAASTTRKKSWLQLTTLSPDLLLAKDTAQSVLARQTSRSGNAPCGRGLVYAIGVDGLRFYFYSHEPNEPPHVSC